MGHLQETGCDLDWTCSLDEEVSSHAVAASHHHPPLGSIAHQSVYTFSQQSLSSFSFFSFFSVFFPHFLPQLGQVLTLLTHHIIPDPMQRQGHPPGLPLLIKLPIIVLSIPPILLLLQQLSQQVMYPSAGALLIKTQDILHPS